MTPLRQAKRSLYDTRRKIRFRQKTIAKAEGEIAALTNLAAQIEAECALLSQSTAPQRQHLKRN